MVAVAGGTGGAGGLADRKTLLYQYRRVWTLASAKLHIPSLNNFTPLWHNVALPEFKVLPDSGLWSSRGIFYLSHITLHGKLKTYENLKLEFSLPDHMYFRYLQLRHAFRAQFPLDDPSIANNPLMEAVKYPDPKKLISNFYSMLSLPTATV